MSDNIVAIIQDTIATVVAEQDTAVATVKQDTATVVLGSGTPGDKGDAGVSITWHGAYDAGHAYAVNDAVSCDGQSYICIAASTGNLPTNAAYWSLLAAKGANGTGTGDVVGPAGATAGHLAIYADATGKVLGDGGAAPGAASDTAAGLVELAIASEVTTGTDATRAVTPDALAGSTIGKRLMGWKVIDDATVLTTGDGKVIFSVPPELNGMNLVSVFASVSTVSSSGNPTVSVENLTDTTVMLSTLLTIDATEYSSNTAATAAVIDTAHDDVATGDRLEINVDVAGTGTKGLFVVLGFQLP